MVRYNFNDFSNNFEENVEMIKYAERTKRRLKGIQDNISFKKVVSEELGALGLNLEALESSVYRERNIALELLGKIKDGKFKRESLKDLLDETSRLHDDEEKFILKINEKYFFLTEEARSFYEQYQKLNDAIFDYIHFEIRDRVLKGKLY